MILQDTKSVPCCANYRQAYTERDAQVCPYVRRNGFEEGADLEIDVSIRPGVDSAFEAEIGTYIEGFAAPGEEHVCAMSC